MPSARSLIARLRVRNPSISSSVQEISSSRSVRTTVSAFTRAPPQPDDRLRSLRAKSWLLLGCEHGADAAGKLCQCLLELRRTHHADREVKRDDVPRHPAQIGNLAFPVDVVAARGQTSE